MIAFLPVKRYRVVYTVGFGRPYSVFERLLLKAIASGVVSLDALVSTFAVHRRVIIEGVVSLMYARWIARSASSTDVTFEITEAGREALRSEELPEQQMVEERYTYVLMEHIGGEMVRSNAVHFQREKTLKRNRLWRLGIPIRPLLQTSEVEPFRVYPLLKVRAEKNEYIKNVDEITPDDGMHYVLVDVDTISGAIRPGSVPKDWESVISSEVVSQVARWERQLEEQNEVVNDEELRTLWQKVNESEVTAIESWQIAQSDLSVLTDAREHREHLFSLLRNARRTIAIVSPTLNAATIGPLAANIKRAALNGVNVDILCGELDEDAIGVISELEKESHESGGRLYIGASSPSTNARFVIGDVEGVFTVAVGSFNWLGASCETTSTCASIVLRHPGPVSRLCITAADIMARDDKLRTSATSVALRNIGAELEQKSREFTMTSDKAVDVRLVFDAGHRSAFASTVRNAAKEIVIVFDGASEIGIRSASKLLEHAAASGARVLCIDSSLSTDQGTDDQIDLLQKYGVNYRRISGFKCNCIIADENVALVSSFPWFRYVAQCPRIGNDIGVLIEGNGVGELAAKLRKSVEV